MKTKRYFLNRLLSGAALLMGTVTASAHIGYSGRDFGTVVPNAAPITISNQAVTSNFGWADGTDADFGDSHKLRAFRFSLSAPGYVTITFSGSTNEGTRDGTIKPGFSVFQGLAHLAPITNAPGSADHDGSAISQAYLASLGGVAKEGAFRSLADWRIGGDNQTGPVFNFDAADGLSTFVFKGYAVDGDSSLFGDVPGVVGDGNADGTVTKSFFLPAGDFSIFVGGVNYAGQSPTPDATSYGLVGTISASSSYVAGDPAAGGIGYQHQINLGSKTSVSFSGHVGAWSWEDNALFDAEAGEPPVGWTHTSNWAAVRLQKDTILTVTMTRDANVPWPSSELPYRRADIASMFPSLTLYRGWDNDDGDDHSYNNRGNIDWAEDLQYADHVDNSTEETITRTWFLPAGDYTFALGSNAPATNTNRQGYSITFTSQPSGPVDPVPNTYPEPDYIGTGGVGYAHTILAGKNESGSVSGLVGAWSWEDNALFGNDGQGSEPVGWTHTSNWVALRLETQTIFTITVERDATVPDPTTEEPERLADTSSMFPSFTLYKGWDNDGSDSHTYNNRGNVAWAEDITYHDHFDNSTATTITRSYLLPAGEYSIVIGSNAPATNPNSQGYKVTYSTGSQAKVDPVLGDEGIGYTYTVLAGAGETGSFSSHVGAWSWEDNALFSPGQPPVGWTHTSNWLALKLEEDVYFSLTVERDATVPWPSLAAPDRKADTSSLFPSLTLYRGWDNDGADLHTYNNRGNVLWAEDIRYVDHVDNSTADKITRTWRLPAGEYSLALGSNAPANNALRQGYKATYKTASAANILAGDPAEGGIGYAHVISVGRGDSGSFSNHVGAWSWEDNALFNEANGDAPVGWTHTSRWVAVHVKDNLTLNLTVSRDANVAWPSTQEPNRLADTSSMFPSFTLWRGWDNDGTDSHTYNNRGNVAWAEDITYFDHYDNSTAGTITRSYTLTPGYYTIAVGSNAPANNSLRQGFNFAWNTGIPAVIAPVITQQPKSVELVAGKTTTLSVKAIGPNLSYQWKRNGKPLEDGAANTLVIEETALSDAGNYTVEVRNAAGWVHSVPAAVAVIAVPVVNDFDIPDLIIGQPYQLTLGATNNPVSLTVKGLPRGLSFDSKTRTISGRPQVVATSVTVEVVAANKAGKSEPVTDTFAITALPTGIHGSFTGPLGRDASINGLLGGSVKFQVTATGGLTGTITLGSKAHKVAALLDTSLAAPAVSFSLPRAGQSALQVSLRADSAAKAVYGEITDGSTVLPFIARQPLSPAGAYAGDYTLALLLDEPNVGHAALPQGSSIGAFKLAPTGAATGVVVLADNTKLTFGGLLEQNGHLTVFGVLYKGVGSLLGAFSIEAPVTVGENSVTSGNLAMSEFSWFKGEVVRDRTYAEGFGPLELEVVGRKYITPASDELALGAQAGPNNAKISFTEGGAPDPSTRLNLDTLEIGLKTTKITEPNPAKIKLTVVAGVSGKFVPGTSGSFRGTLELTDTDTTVTPNKPLKRPVSFQGMIVDDGESLKGYGFFLLPQMPTLSPLTTAKTSPILSGSVWLEAVQNIE